MPWRTGVRGPTGARTRWAPAVEARIVALRIADPGWGPRTILAKLDRELPGAPLEVLDPSLPVRQG